MSDRIRELASQACFDEIGKDYSLYFNLTKTKVERFASLLIDECLTVVNQPNGVGDDDVIRISNDIKSHFGLTDDTISS